VMRIMGIKIANHPLYSDMCAHPNGFGMYKLFALFARSRWRVRCWSWFQHLTLLLYPIRLTKCLGVRVLLRPLRKKALGLIMYHTIRTYKGEVE
jgi:hypothetical protein